MGSPGCSCLGTQRVPLQDTQTSLSSLRTTPPPRRTASSSSARTAEGTTSRAPTLAATALHPTSGRELTSTGLLSALLDVQPVVAKHERVCGDGGGEAGWGGEFDEGAVLVVLAGEGFRNGVGIGDLHVGG